MKLPKTLCAFFPITILAVFGMIGLFAQAPDPSAPVRALYVCGGCCHDYDTQKLLIKIGLEERSNMEVDIVHQGGKTTGTMIDLYKDPNWSEGYDVVIHHECFAGVKDKDFVDGILKPHQEGLPAVVIHCAMHSYRVGDDRWFKFCGVRSHGHGKHYPHEVLNVNAGHPVMKNFPAGWWSPEGELYRVAEVFDTATALATSKDQETGEDHLTVWTNDYQGTRVFGTTLGHHNEVFEAPVFMEMLTRGTLWAAGKLDDAYLKEPTPESRMKPVNLAAGKAASASSEERGKENFAAKAFDGSSKSRWCAAGATFPQWLQVDLGEVQPIRGAIIDWESKNNAYDHRIAISKDGEEWTEVAKAESGGSTQHAFEAEGRYVKVEVLGSSSGGWASIWDFQVHGTEMIEIDSASASEKEIELLKTVKVPENFEATIFAMPPAVNYPTFVKATPDGIVFVSQDKNGSLAREKNHGSILRCVDLDGDGRADQVNRFVANLDSPRGLEWDGEWLYCLHPPNLSRFRDTDGDGVADETEVLVEGIAFGFEDRPADHTSNGITLGIDGWIYCAIGDFGFMNAKGTDGTEIQFRGGGVVRVRRDGTGMHIFSRGTRNIYEIAVGPTLEAFTRDNTNDGGGWDVRLHHFTGLDHHGYPSLYRNFSEETVQPLRDYGGGSGVGSVWIDEPGYPEPYRNIPCTVDWGPGWVYAHQLTKKGATFKEEKQIEFIQTPRSTDATIDAGGRIYVSSWKDGKFKYEGEEIGYVARVQPKNHAARPVPDFAQLSDENLAKAIGDESFTVRRYAQFALLRRGLTDSTRQILQEMATRANAEKTAAAALFTLVQSGDELPIPFLAKVLKLYPEVGTRALAEIGQPIDDPAIEIVATDPAVRLEIVRWLAATADAPDTLIDLTDDEDPIVAHTAINALIHTNASEACLAALDSPGALRALQAMHEPSVVEGLIAALPEAGSEIHAGILKTLARLYYQEGEWNKESWGTRPDTTGPYYKRVTWEMSEKIAETLRAALADSKTDKAALLAEVARNQIDLDDSIPTVLKLAQDDPGLEKALVDLVLKKGETPPEAVQLLIKVATSTDREGELRLNAARALAQSRDPYAFEVAFDLAARRNEIESIPHVKNWLLDAISKNPELENRYEALIAIAHGANEPAGIMAYGVLLSLLDRKPLAPETKGEIETALEETQLESDTGHYVRLLKAITQNKHRNGKDIVLAAATHSDPQVVKAAKSAANAIRLDLDGAKKSKGPLIATMKPEQVLSAVLKIKGDPGLGEALFTQQTCAVCHTMNPDDPLKGPYLGNITGIYKGRDLAEAILDPNKSIAQGFHTNLFTLKDGNLLMGFVSKEAADEIEVRDIAGQVKIIKPDQIAKREESPASMMPPGLVNNLTLEEFVALLAYLEKPGS